ncbi:UvrABC system protein C [Bienertia sinuspersici]
MGKKRGRERIVNPQPFLAERNAVVSKKSSKRSHQQEHQQQEQMISNSMSDKILKEHLSSRKIFLMSKMKKIPPFLLQLRKRSTRKKKN